MHYQRFMRHGDVNKGRPEKYGEKRNHPLYVRYRQLVQRNAVCEEWLNFWKFVEDVGEQPENCTLLKRFDNNKPLSKTNFYWAKNQTPESIAEYQKKYREKNARQIKSTIFIRKYGISIEEYDKIFEAQNGVCAICSKPERVRIRNNGRPIRMMAIDHCHNSSKVRGLLCLDCNTGLGSFKDSLEVISSAVSYLQKHQT